MFGKLGPVGVLGVFVLLSGVALLAWVDLLIGAGVALVVAGLGLAVYGMVSNLLGMFGMGGAL